MNVLKAIKSRRSIRKFKDRPIAENLVNEILEAGRWAPSGLNNQPWRFITVQDRETIKNISQFTKYGKVILDAPLLIAVFLDNAESYNRTKDLQAAGSCIQNMLLACHSLELGACWMGEILNKHAELEKFLGVGRNTELMAVLAIGYPDEKATGERVRLKDLVLRRT